MSEQTMPNWLDQRAFLTPERVALVTEDEILTFSELQKRTKEMASRLSSLGIQKDEHIAVYAKSSVEMVQMIHALSYLGAVGVMLNTRLTIEELVFQVTDSSCAYIIGEDSFKDTLKEIGKQTETPSLSFEELKGYQTVPSSMFEEVIMDAPYTILYTSGTTGSPKGVMLSYSNHWWSAVSSALNLGITEKDQWLAALPLFHVGGLSILMKSVIYGMPVHLHTSFDIEAVHDAIMNKGVTTVSVVSVMLDGLLDRLGSERYPANFRGMLLGGGPAPEVLLHKAAEKSVPVFQTYGMTETASQIVTLSPDYALDKIGSAGKPLFPAQLSIELDGKPTSAHEIGEIVVKGPMVTAGYYRRPETNEDTIQQGWLRTGDLGFKDEDGFLYVVDRRKDLIISGGENIYPAEIEGVLSSLEKVKEVGVVGKEDEKWGSVPVAFIVVREGMALTREDIAAFQKEHLASYKQPKEIYFVNHLPRNATNKLLRRELANWLKQRRNVQ
ncbi:o-succinylbenzoate--CoA ligase [Pontibacillus salipaludis]|uniref:2-succinylbenzoate--CoA ligase n=1 Tax=Pontibacillus salipaludis TaxID=1697394 RepID=A0ABQ1PXV1_9BACI|nr:o-succinylbenzoate--CoA ligase [Pontibacillus salipaludis]GGD06193.1 2-succinylbenzoate--CoA ligase [Pontibacillus salipaludis]